MRVKLSLALTIIFASSFGNPMLVLSQGDRSVSIFNQQQIDGSSRGRPGRREGTGSRGDCPVANIPLTALVPANNSGLAVEENPTFWFYVPAISQKTVWGEFSLQNEQNQNVDRITFSLPNKSGIINVKSPSTKPLEIDKTYYWYFKLYCDRQKLSAPVFVYGRVRRVAPSPNLKNSLKAAIAPLDRVTLYAQNGIWYSALTELAQLRQTQPQNITLDRHWTDILSDVGLEKLSKEPILKVVSRKS
ncbi:DUF928 domain-containing protein [Scytonema millei]|nr:DUF928 domain-containing protein [Scytonema millei]